MKWQTVYLQDLVVFQRGFDITKAEQVEGNIPVVSSSGIASYHNVAKNIAPGIVIGRKGTLGSVHYLNVPFWAHDTTLWAKEIKGDARFIYYLLSVLKLEQFDVGGANPTLNRNHIHKLKVSVPSVNIQKKIAKTLSNYDDLIENNLKRMKLLEELVRLSYEEWFLRFRIDGKKLEIDNETGLPFGWVHDAIGSLVKFHGGYAFKSKDYEEGQKYKIVTIKNVQDGYFIPNTTDTLSTIPDNIKSSQKLKNGDYIMSLTGNVGRVCLVYGEGYLLNQRVVKLEPKNKADYSFLYSLFRHENMLVQLENISNGAAQQNLSPVNAAKIKLSIPDKDTRQKFNNKIKPSIEMIVSLNLQNQLLKEARDILLPRLMTDMIDVEDMELTV